MEACGGTSAFGVRSVYDKCFAFLSKPLTLRFNWLSLSVRNAWIPDTLVITESSLPFTPNACNLLSFFILYITIDNPLILTA